MFSDESGSSNQVCKTRLDQMRRSRRTLVDVGAIGLLSRLRALLLVAACRRGLLSGLLLLGWCLASWGFARRGWGLMGKGQF